MTAIILSDIEGIEQFKKENKKMITVSYAIDSLDPNPMIKTFDTESEALEWVSEETQRRVEHIVQHSPHSISEEEYEELLEQETLLVDIEG